MGTLVRAAIEGAFPAERGTWPWATFLINIVGSFALGFLLESLGRLGDDTGWRRHVRLGVGTGVIGGFTTYSTFVLELHTLYDSDRLVLAVAYALISVVLGISAALAGLATSDRLVADRHFTKENQ